MLGAVAVLLCGACGSGSDVGSVGSTSGLGTGGTPPAGRVEQRLVVDGACASVSTEGGDVWHESCVDAIPEVFVVRASYEPPGVVAFLAMTGEPLPTSP